VFLRVAQLTPDWLHCEANSSTARKPDEPNEDSRLPPKGSKKNSYWMLKTLRIKSIIRVTPNPTLWMR